MFKYRFAKPLVVVGVLLVIFASFAIVSMLAQDSGMSDEPTVINFTLSEYQFQMEGMEANAPLELETGKEYELHFINGGTTEHEVLIGSNPIEIEGGNHHDFENQLLDDVEVEITGVMNDEDFAIGVSGLIEFEINPGQELSITFTLPEDKVGDWEIGCFVSLSEDATEKNPGAGHYDAGMHMPLSVVMGMESES